MISVAIFLAVMDMRKNVGIFILANTAKEASLKLHSMAVTLPYQWYLRDLMFEYRYGRWIA